MTLNGINRDGVVRLGFNDWAAFMQSICDPGIDIHIDKDRSDSFNGWARPVDCFGLLALDQGAYGVHFERTARGAKLGSDDYAVSLQLAGHCFAFQNDRVIRMIPGDLMLFDSTRAAERRDDGHTFVFKVPRQLVVSHLGYEPEGGRLSRGSLAGRLLFQLVDGLIKGDDSELARGDPHMEMAFYDLLGAAFAQPDGELRSGASHTDKLFERVCGVIRDGVTDPDLTPSKVAAEAGISLRYLQKLFTPKGTTCIHFIHSLRLDHAVRLLHRRSVFGGRPSLSEIALASGFRDYAFFSRKFRERFGCMPSAYLE